MESKQQQEQEQPLTKSELAFLILSLGSVVASLHYLLSIVF